MNLYNLDEIFAVNDQIDCELIKENWGIYIKVKNFWKNPDKIRELFLSTPCISLPGACYQNENGKKYFDGRNIFPFMNPQKFSDVVFYIIHKYLEIDTHHIELKWKIPTLLFGNVFQMYDEKFNTYDTHYYAPHTDGVDQIACTWYMNENYDEGDGTSIYDKTITETEECMLNMIDSPWTNSVNKIGHIPAEYNSLVIYSGDISHGQAVTKRWFDEKRLTLVQFYNDKRIFK